MVILFGDSWARQSWQHSKSNVSNGYQHWSLDDTWVINTDTWLNQYFHKSLTVNFARFGNTLDWINRDLFHSLATVSNLPERVDFVVFQTDPLRIFAPRQDYNDRAIVWPNFSSWCDQMQFDWQIKNLEDLLQVIYQDWYQNLAAFHYIVQKANPNKTMRLWLLGGVSALHPTVRQFRHNIIMHSVTGFFGFDNDCCLENRASLASLIKFWTDNLRDDNRRHSLRQEWVEFDNILNLKEAHWIQHPEYFAGRHLTSKAMSELAAHIEQTIDQ